MPNSQWTPIWNYSDAALRRIAANARDMRSSAAIRELTARGVQVAA